MEAIYHIQQHRLALIDFISMQDIYELSEHNLSFFSIIAD
jgi:hypothetical protein